MPPPPPAAPPAEAPAPASSAADQRDPVRTAEAVPAVVTPAAAAPAVTAAEPSEDDWTAEELAEVRAELAAQARDLRGEIDDAEAAAAVAQRDAAGEGPGDEADAGSKTFEREHEMSLANNSRDLLQQVERALARIDAGTYGRCESCGDQIPKPRLQAFPRATLCVACKQREERR